MKVLLFKGLLDRPEGWHDWRTEEVMDEIEDSLESTGNETKRCIFRYPDKLEIAVKELRPDIVLSLVEYIYDEDGNVCWIPDILDSINASYVASDSEAIRTSINKNLSKVKFEEAGIRTPRFRVLKKGNIEFDYNEIDLNYPLILKPNDAGCSAGITFIESPGILPSAVNELWKMYENLILEEYVGGEDIREITVCVLYNGSEKTMFPLEILFPGGDRRKILTDAIKNDPLTDKVKKPDLDIETMRALKDIADIASDSVGYKDIIRVDTRMRNGEIYVIETNLFPGLGDDSYLRRAANNYGVGFDEVVNMMVHGGAIRYGIEIPASMSDMAYSARFRLKG
ncbi:MAG: hypothetical protein ABIF08_04475 [Nanoarchaeota archaeon]